jgi:hypothetical protein
MASDSSTEQVDTQRSRLRSWVLGVAVLFGVVIAARHFSEEKAFVRLAREAKPSWVLAALTLQARRIWPQGEDLVDRWSYGRHSSRRDSGL